MNAVQPWAKPGATWYYSYNTLTFEGYLKYQKTGDTLIQNVLCDKIMRTKYGYDHLTGQWSTNISFEFTYQNNDTVFWLRNNQFIVLYLFNATFNTTWDLPSINCSSSYYNVDFPTTIIINNDTLLYLQIGAYLDSMFAYGTFIIEIIGCGYDLFPINSCQLDNPITELRCYSDSSGFYYSTGIAQYCDYTTGLNETSAYIEDFYISIDVMNQEFVIQCNKPLNKSLSNCHITITDYLGKIAFSGNYNFLNNNILRKGYLLKGLYLFSITSENSFYTKKIILN